MNPNQKKIKLEFRDTLKGYFKNRSRPTQENFESLIDSTINKLEDGISKTVEDGLVLAPEGVKSSRTISFVKKVDGAHPEFSISLVKGDTPGLGIVQPKSSEDEDDETRMFFTENGNIGIQTNQPRTPFEVQGVMGIQSRMGTHAVGTIPADGNWHSVLDGLSGTQGFEVIAQAGLKGTGKHALLHATALATFGQYKNRIRRTQASFGWWWWNRLAIRWKREKVNTQTTGNDKQKNSDHRKYRLEIKTRSNYGSDVKIKYHISKLWDNDMMSLIDSLPEK